MFQVTLLLAVLLTSSTIGAKLLRRSELALHETRDTIPKGFVDEGPADENAVLTLRAALVPRDIAGLEKELYAVSVPTSERYGQFLTKAEVCRFFAKKDNNVFCR